MLFGLNYHLSTFFPQDYASKDMSFKINKHQVTHIKLESVQTHSASKNGGKGKKVMFNITFDFGKEKEPTERNKENFL